VEGEEERAGRDMVPEGQGPGSGWAAVEWEEAAEAQAPVEERVPEEAVPAAKVCGELVAGDPGRAEGLEAGVEEQAVVPAVAGERERAVQELAVGLAVEDPVAEAVPEGVVVQVEAGAQEQEADREADREEADPARV